MGARYVVDENDKRVGVFLDIEEYERVVEEIEELEDAPAAEEVRAAIERGEEELIPFDQAIREIEEGRATGDRAIAFRFPAGPKK